jgi:transcription antitermination factor NusG
MKQDSISKDLIINQLSVNETKWFAIYTKYKCEKFVADLLVKKGIEAYLPLMTRTRRYTRKIKQYLVPLINCYVFVCINKGQYIKTLETEYVLKFLKQGKDLLAIPHHEIDLLKRVAGDVTDVEIPVGYLPEAGEDVEVSTGHLAGLKGKIVSRTSKKVFLIELETIGFKLRIDIDMKLLKPVNNPVLIG